MHRRRVPLAAALAAAAVVGAGGGAGVYAAAASSGGTKTVVRQVPVAAAIQPTASTTPLSVSQIYQRSYKGVVEITVTSTESNPYGFGSQPQQAQGSGFVYDGKGDIVTNQHVVAGASSISVRFWNGATYKARLVGTDPSTDLAVIRVDAPSALLSPLALGNSDSLEVGDGLVAIGSPFGLENSVTSGIVSALHRQMTSPNGFAIDDSIQTDAANNHGNSGGPRLNTQGQIVAVAAQIESDSGGSDGVGFGIPSNTVRSVVGQILTSGKAEHAYLGVAVEPVQAGTSGAKVAQVRTGTPAAKAGLRAGDVITRVDGKRITSSVDLQNEIGSRRPGTTVSITYLRSGQTHIAHVQLTSRPS
jgi:putative serine protease PepD